MPSKTTKNDIWMPIYIGDYLADTADLDAERSGCYLLWLMYYWRKGPLPDSIDDLVLIGKLRGQNAPGIVQTLLTQFFTLEADGMYHQKRADHEKTKSTQLKNRNIKGGQTRVQIATRQSNGRFAPAYGQPDVQPNRTQAGSPLDQPNFDQNSTNDQWATYETKNSQPSQPDASQQPAYYPANSQPSGQPKSSPSQSQSHKEQELKLLSPEATYKIRPEEFGNAWNRNCEPLPRIDAFTESRKKKVSLRMKQGLTLEKFTDAVKLCTQKPFLRGNGNRGWKASFDWLIQNDTNIQRVFEEDWGIGGGKINGRPSAESKQAATHAAFDQYNAELDAQEEVDRR